METKLKIFNVIFFKSSCLICLTITIYCLYHTYSIDFNKNYNVKYERIKYRKNTIDFYKYNQTYPENDDCNEIPSNGKK